MSAMSAGVAGRYMPPEWHPHDGTWMGFPKDAYEGSGVSREAVQRAWAAVANAIADHEPVHMVCNPESEAAARKFLSAAVTLHLTPFDDAWLRDSGPTVVIDAGKPIAIDWRFNGWGDNTAFDWQQDAQLARFIAETSGLPIESSPLTNEGGGIHVDGNGRVLLTDTVQLDPNRNPDWDRERVETEIHQRLGTREAIWLPRGLYRDYLPHGTRGHVDIVACFCPDGRVLLHQQQDSSHPDHALFTTLQDCLERAGLAVTAIPAPTTLRDNSDWVDYSYINHYVLNGAVILPTFDDRNDALVVELLADAYPGRAIRKVDARVIFAMGGGVHCITQQMPSAPEQDQ